MTRIRFRYLLPCLNLALAALLQRVAAWEAAEHLALTNSIATWDYVPPALQLSRAINFPAFAVSALSTRLIVQNPTAAVVAYFACLSAMWFLVGMWADKRRARPVRALGARTFTIVRFLGALCSVAIAMDAALAARLHPIVGIAGLSWAAALAWASFTRQAGERGPRAC